jgi:hypothetical protein
LFNPPFVSTFTFKKEKNQKFFESTPTNSFSTRQSSFSSNSVSTSSGGGGGGYNNNKIIKEMISPPIIKVLTTAEKIALKKK